MNEIKCPHCGKVFQVDERGFADILRQVRTAEFDKEIAQREGMLQERNAQAVKLAVAKAQQDAQAETAQRDARIAELETRLAAEKREREQAEKSSQIEHANELEAALAKKQAEIVQLQADVKKLSADHDAQNRIAKAEHERLLSDATAQRDAEIAALRQQISSQESAFKQQLESACSSSSPPKRCPPIKRKVLVWPPRNLQSSSKPLLRRSSGWNRKLSSSESKKNLR